MDVRNQSRPQVPQMSRTEEAHGTIHGPIENGRGHLVYGDKVVICDLDLDRTLTV